MRILILAFVAGIVVLQQQAHLPALGWAAALVPLWALALYWRPGYVRRGLLLALTVAAGFFWSALIAQHRLDDNLPLAWEGKEIQVVGVVAALPQFTERGVRFEFDVEQVLTPGAQVPRHIQLFWFARADDAEEDALLNPGRLHAGERWQFVVRLKRPHGTANPSGFDYEAWLLEQNLRATGYVRKDPNNFRIDSLVLRPNYLIERARDHIALRLQAVLQDAPYRAVLTALAIGDQHAIAQDQWRIFFRTGVNHLMSISGLHITLFSTLVFFMVQAAWRRSPRLTLWLPARKAAVLFGLSAALLYALLTGFAVPAQRTLYMLAMVAAALWLNRLASPSRLLALALWVVVVLDPWAVLAPGFWLSFGAVATIFYITALRIAAPASWVQALRVQGAVTLALVPAMLFLFQQVSLVSPVANAIAIPVVSYVIVPLTLIGTFLPVDFLLHAAHAVMGWLVEFLAGLAHAPDALWQQHAPPLWSIALAIPGLAWLLAPRGFPARPLGSALLLPMVLWLPPPLPPGKVQVTVLDVGQGLAVLVRTREHALVYDTGARFSADVDSGARTVLPYLRALGVRRLDGLVVSHADNDHSGGALSVLDGVPVAWLLSSVPQEHALRQRGVPSLSCYAGQNWEWDGVRFAVLHPALATYAEKRKSNDRGCVLRIQAGSRAVLLPADIEAKSEREIVQRDAASLRADVLLVPHHGSRTSSTPQFIAAVQPEWAIFTVGYRNRFGHPRPDIVARYAQASAHLLQSDSAGAITIEFGATGGLEVTAYRTKDPRYWRGL